MAYKIKFKKKSTVNGIEYKRGDTLSVSTSIYENLKAEGLIDEKKKATTTKVKKDD